MCEFKSPFHSQDSPTAKLRYENSKPTPTEALFSRGQGKDAGLVKRRLQLHRLHGTSQLLARSSGFNGMYLTKGQLNESLGLRNGAMIAVRTGTIYKLLWSPPGHSEGSPTNKLSCISVTDRMQYTIESTSIVNCLSIPHYLFLVSTLCVIDNIFVFFCDVGLVGRGSWENEDQC